MKKLQKLRIFSFAKFQAVLMALLGLLAGILYSFGGLLIDILISLDWVTTTETPGLSFGSILAFGALLGMPIIFAIAGYLGGIIEATLYNFFARWFGGMKVEFE